MKNYRSFLYTLSAVAVAFLLAQVFLQVSPTFAQSDAPANGNLRVLELDSKPFLCDGTTKPISAYIGAARVRKVVLWFGADSFTHADIRAWLGIQHKDATLSVIAKATWDHYAETTGVGGQVLTYDFAPDFVQVNANDQLVLYRGCDNFGMEWRGEQDGKRAHVIALVYYLP